MTDRIDPTMMPAMFLTPAGAPAAPAGNRGLVTAEDKSSFLEAMGEAWGKELDKQAASMARLSEHLADPDTSDIQLTIALLTAQSENLKALSTSASTATNSIADALQTLSRKQ